MRAAQVAIISTVILLAACANTPVEQPTSGPVNPSTQTQPPVAASNCSKSIAAGTPIFLGGITAPNPVCDHLAVAAEARAQGDEERAQRALGRAELAAQIRWWCGLPLTVVTLGFL